MFHIGAARRCFAHTLVQIRHTGSASTAWRKVYAQRNLVLSTIVRNSTDREKALDSDAAQSDPLELAPSKYRKRFSLHVSKIPPDTTDEEFRQAFSVLPGLINTELVFNSGPLRDYKGTGNRGFGFLHFESEEATTTAVKLLRMSPIRLQGYPTEISSYKSTSKSPNEPCHVLHLAGLPLELQYLEVVQLLQDKCPYYKSIRFMASKPNRNFLGIAAVAFEDTLSAIKARERLYGATVGGMLLREHNLAYGRALYEEEPTNTLMILGTPTNPDQAYDFRRLLDGFSCIERYKLIKDRVTNDFRGFTIINCGDVENAWKTLEWFNREHPEYRVTFVVSRYQYDQRLEEQGEQLPEGKLRALSRLDE